MQGLCKFYFIFLLTFATESHAQENIDKIKAAFLLNFAKYIEWPENKDKSSGQPFKFCIVSYQSQFEDYKLLEKKTLNEQVISVELTEAPETSVRCDVVFLLDGKGADLSNEIYKHTQGKPILTVSDVDSKGMIYLFEDEGRIKFDVNLQNAQGSGLNFRSQMLQLASQVKN